MADKRVVELLKWIAYEKPELMSMRQPFRPSEVKNMLKYNLEDDVKPVLREMASNLLTGKLDRNADAYTTFEKYTLCRRVFLMRFTAGDNGDKLLTWHQMLTDMDRYGIPQSCFEPVPQPQGKPLWRRVN